MQDRSMQHRKDMYFCGLQKDFQESTWEEIHVCAENNKGGLERQKAQRKPVQGKESTNGEKEEVMELEVIGRRVRYECLSLKSKDLQYCHVVLRRCLIYLINNFL